MNVTIGKMTAADLDQVMEIEKEAFSFPWQREAFLSEIEENACARYIAMKDESGQILAYGGLWLTLDGEAHVTNVAVAAAHRKKGLGEKLMWALMQLASDCGMVWMSLECRRGNIAAQNLYHKLGFIDVGYRKRYYPDNLEDALVMCRLSLPEPNEDGDPDLIEE